MPSYTFSTGVPLSTQKLSSTQPVIESNFQATSEWLNINHMGFSQSVDYGKHNLTTLVQVPGNTDPSTLSTEMSVYCKSVSGDSNGYEVFCRYPSNGSIEQLTGSTVSGVSGTSWTYITSTLLMKWGTFTTSLTSPNVFVFPTGGGIPVFTTEVYIVQFGTNQSGSINSLPFVPYNITTTQFGYQLTGLTPLTSSNTLSWIAIGV